MNAIILNLDSGDGLVAKVKHTSLYVLFKMLNAFCPTFRARPVNVNATDKSNTSPVSVQILSKFASANAPIVVLPWLVSNNLRFIFVKYSLYGDVVIFPNIGNGTQLILSEMAHIYAGLTSLEGVKSDFYGKSNLKCINE